MDMVVVSEITMTMVITYTRLSSDPKISNCIITGNYTGYSGGGMCNYGRYGSCSPTIINCAFINNSSAEFWWRFSELCFI